MSTTPRIVRGLGVPFLLVALASISPSMTLAQARPADIGIAAAGIGPVQVSTTEGELVSLLGRDVIVRFTVFMGEGACAPGTRVFPGTDDEIVVTWTDTTYTSIQELSISRPNSPWRTPQGVGIGTTLKELEAIARAPIQFSGFGWDYGGLLGWTEADMRVSLRLAPTGESYQTFRRDERFIEISGDKAVSSDHSLVREMTIVVNEIMVPGPGGRGLPFDCPEAQ